jgi:hypothetical protein
MYRIFVPNIYLYLVNSRVQIGDRNSKWGVVVAGPTYLYGVLGWVPPVNASKKEEGTEGRDANVGEFTQPDLSELIKKANESSVEGKEREKKPAPLMMEVGKEKGEVSIPDPNSKDKVKLPDWTLTFRCFSVTNMKLVIDFFVKHGFIILDI